MLSSTVARSWRFDVDDRTGVPSSTECLMLKSEALRDLISPTASVRPAHTYSCHRRRGTAVHISCSRKVTQKQRATLDENGLMMRSRPSTKFVMFTFLDAAISLVHRTKNESARLCKIRREKDRCSSSNHNQVKVSSLLFSSWTGPPPTGTVRVLCNHWKISSSCSRERQECARSSV